jgi:integrase/recombinase XerD
MDIKASYKEELTTLGYSHLSVEQRIRDIIRIETFTQKQVTQINTKDIENYINHFVQRKLHSDAIKAYHRHVQQYFVYLEREQIIKKNPFNYYEFDIEKQSKTPREILTQEQIKKVYQVAQKGVETIILHLCYGCGLRAKELELINIDDTDIQHKTVAVQRGKNNKYRIIPINDKITQDLNDYLQIIKRTNPTQTALLLNHNGVRMKRYTALVRLQKIAKRANINQNITLHGLRHSIATHLIENGVKITQVQDFLGHKQLETTEIYTRISTYQLRKMT